LLLFFILLSLIPLAVVSLLSYWQNQSALQQRVSNEFENSTVLQQQGIEQWITERKDDVVTVAEANQVQSMDPEQVAEVVQELYDRWGIYQNMFVLTPDGERLFDTSGATSNLVDRGYFKQAMQGEVNVSDILISRVSGKPIIVFAAPVISDGNVVGVAGAVIRTVFISTLLEQSWVGETGDAYLINEEGFFVTEPRVTEELKQAGLVEESPILEMQVDTVGGQEVLAGNSGSDQYQDFRGKPVLGAYRHLEDLRWGLLLEQEVAEAFATVTQLRNLVLTIIIVSVIVVVAVAIWIANSLTKPVTQITQAAQTIAQGNFDVKAEVEANDETSILADAFNSMTERLRSLIDTLEERIQERTRALETSSDISSQVIAIRDIDELLQYVVARLQTEFNFYHAHIYLIEEETGDLVMVEGSGEVGQQLKEKRHRLEPGHGIVGTVASTNEAFLSNNVDDLLNFVRNPLLPDTKSELAVPLRKGDEVLGVLDIQSEKIDRFAPSDQSLMQSIANQTAIAIDNARLLAETQVALQEVERLNLQLTGEVWEEFAEELPAVGYRYRDGVSTPLMPSR